MSINLLWKLFFGSCYLKHINGQRKRKWKEIFISSYHMLLFRLETAKIFKNHNFRNLKENWNEGDKSTPFLRSIKINLQDIK